MQLWICWYIFVYYSKNIHLMIISVDGKAIMCIMIIIKKRERKFHYLINISHLFSYIKNIINQIMIISLLLAPYFLLCPLTQIAIFSIRISESWWQVIMFIILFIFLLCCLLNREGCYLIVLFDGFRYHLYTWVRVLFTINVIHKVLR